MRPHLILAAAAALGACSPAPASTAEAPVDAAAAPTVAGATDASVPAEARQDPPVREAIPADPDRPMGGGMREIPPGGLTLAQFQDRSMERFGRADANKDGVVDAAEMEAMGRGARRLGRADADGDGHVTAAEARAAAAEMFRRMDQNADGRVTEDERPQR